MQLFIHEVIEKAAAAKKVEEKVAILQQYNSMGLRDIIKITYDTRIQWLIPTSEVPYEASEEHNWATNLVKNTKRLMHCIAPNGNQVKPFKRENIFISLLEGIHPKDAPSRGRSSLSGRCIPARSVIVGKTSTSSTSAELRRSIECVNQGARTIRGTLTPTSQLLNFCH